MKEKEIMVKLSDIKPYKKNAKQHPKKQVDEIAFSIKKYSFNQPIVLDAKNVIIVGHGRYEAAKMDELDRLVKTEKKQ